MIYLDYAANTPVDPLVLETFCRVERAFPGNPNSAHPAGERARAELERVTGAVAAMLGVSPAELIFTSGATESNNLAIKGVAQATARLGRHIIGTRLEHPSVGEALEALRKRGWEVDLAGVDREGRLDLDQVRKLLRQDTVLVSVSAVDSELGAVQPVQELAGLLKGYPNCRLHVDASQAVGKTELRLDGVDTMTISPHKFYGLNGSGLLFKRRNVPLEPLIHGGGGAYRGGTPALALAAALEHALRLALDGREERTEYVRALNRWLRGELASRPGVQINSPEGAVPYILNLSVQGIKGTAFQRALAQRGVCVSVRTACSTDGGPSQAVLAVSGDRRNALSSWRLSLSHLTGREELERFLEIFDACRRELGPAEIW